MSFQKTVLIIALIVLSVMLIFIALAMKGLKNSQEYPPEVSECPDFWTKNSSGVCKPMSGLNSNTNKPFKRYDPNKEEWVVDTTKECNAYTKDVDKAIYAKTCGIEWDGLTNV